VLYRVVFFILTVTLLSACSSTVNKNTLAVIKDDNVFCKDEISKNISVMLNSDKLFYDKNSFKQNSYLYLNNEKISELKIKPSKNSKYVTFVIYKDDGKCILSMIDKNNNIKKSHHLSKCSCIRSKSI